MESITEIDKFVAAFSFIHQKFIDRLPCARLIHFQGYNASLLPLVVKKIPSMRIS